MKTVWQIFRRDMHSLMTHFFALAVVAAIALLPSLYAWLNIYSNWDPYGNTGNISIAVVSLDRGCTTEDGETVNEGQDIVESLRDSVSINWIELEDKDAAINGVYAGDYYAAVVIGENFSYDLNHMLTDLSGKPTITYYQNDKKNAVATKITDTAVSTLRQKISESYLDVLFDTVFRDAGTLSQSLSDIDPEGSVIDLLTQTRALVRSCGDTLDAFAAAPAVSADSSALDVLIGQLSDADGAKLDSVAELDRGMLAALNQVQDALTRTQQAAENDTEGSGAAEQLQAIDQTIANAANIATKTGDHLQNWSDVLAGSGNAVGSAAAQQAQALAQRFYDIGSRLQALPSLEGDRESILAAVDDGFAAVESIRQQISDTMIPTLEDLSATAEQAAEKSQEMLDGLQGTAADIRTLLQQADKTMQSADSSMTQVKDSLAQASEQLTQLLSCLSDRNDESYWDTMLELLGGDTDSYGSYFAQMVQTQTETVYPIDNYGSAMAPFYTVLAIWVGGVMLATMLKVHARRDGLLNPTSTQLFFGRYLLFFLLSQLQAAIIITGDLLLLGVQCTHPGLLYLTGALTSLTFSLLIYAMAISFGDVGKAIVVVVMVLQIAGSSGTFPIELLPEFYQKIYHLFPFPYAIDAMRECISELYGNCWITNIGKLLIFAAVGLGIGLLVRRPFIGLNTFVEEKLEETELL